MIIPKSVISPDWEQRFIEKINFGDKDECWLWAANLDQQGYGKLAINGRVVGAHRLARLLWGGEIPLKMVVDHLCRIKKCVSPHHLSCCTQSVNMLRAREAERAERQNLSTSCRHGLLVRINPFKVKVPERMIKCPACRLLIPERCWN